MVFNPLPSLPPGGKGQQHFPLGGNGKGGKELSINDITYFKVLTKIPTTWKI